MDQETPHGRLKSAREGAGFDTVSDAARSLGMKVPTYTHHENGNREFDRESALKYGRRFNVNPAWLMFGPPYPKNPKEIASPFDDSNVKDLLPELASGSGVSVSPRTDVVFGSEIDWHVFDRAYDMAKVAVEGLPTPLSNREMTRLVERFYEKLTTESAE